MSMKIARDGATAIRGCKNEYIDSLVSQFVGVFNKLEQQNQDNDNRTVKLVDTKTIMSMSQDQLKNLYDTIIKQVIGDGNE